MVMSERDRRRVMRAFRSCPLSYVAVEVLVVLRERLYWRRCVVRGGRRARCENMRYRYCAVRDVCAVRCIALARALSERLWRRKLYDL